MNDDHMDELFRKAAAEYPLDTKGADWSKVSAGMRPPQDSHGFRRLGWLLLLLPLPFLCHHLADGSGNPGSKVGTEGNVQTPKEDLILETVTRGRVPLDADSKEESKEKAVPAGNGEEKVVTIKPLAIEKSVTSDRKQVATTSGYKKVAGHVARKIVPVSPVDGMVKHPSRMLAATGEGQVGMGTGFVKGDEDLLQSRAGRAAPVMHAFPEPLPAMAALPSPIRPEAGKKEKVSKRLYAGLMGGVDATSIRFQKVEKAGYDLGLLLGYELTGRISLETGLFYNKKFYYSKGEHYKGSAYLPPNTMLQDLEGSCEMWEIPLSLRYTFQKKAKSTLFATGGISSYIMNRQEYALNYYYAQTGQTTRVPYTYDETARYWLAVVQFSVGYTRQVGKVGSIRIEPYVKLPARNVGAGDFPLHSAGLRIGITRNLF